MTAPTKPITKLSNINIMLDINAMVPITEIIPPIRGFSIETLKMPMDWSNKRTPIPINGNVIVRYPAIAPSKPFLANKPAMKGAIISRARVRFDDSFIPRSPNFIIIAKSRIPTIVGLRTPTFITSLVYKI